MIWGSFRLAENRSAVKLDQTKESVTMFGQSPTCLPKVSPLAAPDRVQPAAGGAVRLRPPQLRLRDPGGLRRQPPVRVEARPVPLCLHGVRTHISRYTHTVQIAVNRTSPCRKCVLSLKP